MTGLDPENVVEAIEVVVSDDNQRPHVPQDYSVDNCSERVVRFIISTHRRHEAWNGLRGKDDA